MTRNIELEKQIDAYIKGHLSESEAQELWEELLKHPEYIELLNTELGVQSIVADRSDDETTERHTLIHTLQNSWKWVGAAAAAAVLIVAINFFGVDGSHTLQEQAIGHINLSENLASAPVLRSEREQIAPEDSLLNLGFKAAVDGDLEKAISLYEKITLEYPDQPAAVQAHLNKGIIHFNRAKFKEAIASFTAVAKKAEDRSFTREKSFWYLGNAYINTDQPAKARKAIFEAYSMDGIYRKPAINLLKKLDEELDLPEKEYKQ